MLLLEIELVHSIIIESYIYQKRFSDMYIYIYITCAIGLFVGDFIGLFVGDFIGLFVGDFIGLVVGRGVGVLPPSIIST